MKKQLIKTLEGTEKEIKINIINGEEMANIFEEYINLDATEGEEDLSKLLKNPSRTFHFFNECFKKSVEGVDITEVSGGTVQKIIKEHLQYILDMQTDEQVKN